MKAREDTRRMRAATSVALVALCLCPSIQAQGAESKESAKKTSGKHHVLKATKETVQWGWLDPNEPPKLTVHSGDTISIETLAHSMDAIHPGVPMEEIVRLRKANPGGGPHSVTGPIFVTEAEPGDVMVQAGLGDAADFGDLLHRGAVVAAGADDFCGRLEDGLVALRRLFLVTQLALVRKHESFDSRPTAR